MRNTITSFLLLSLLVTCGAKIDRLEAEERDHFTALRIWMSDKDQKAYLKNKTREARDAWLKEHNLWERFYQYDERMRSAIVAGEVASGWTRDAVYMAWGQPFQKQRLPGRRASRSELLVYRFEVAPDGDVLVWAPGSKVTHRAIDTYQIELYVDDDTVTEIQRKEDWE